MHYVNSVYMVANKITQIYPSKHYMIQASYFNRWSLFSEVRKSQSLQKPKWMTCGQRNAIRYANKRYIIFILQWWLLCLGLTTFPQQTVGNFRCAWIEPNKQQLLGQMMIVRRQLSDWSAKSFKWQLLNTSFLKTYSTIIIANFNRKLGLR